MVFAKVGGRRMLCALLSLLRRPLEARQGRGALGLSPPIFAPSPFAASSEMEMLYSIFLPSEGDGALEQAAREVVESPSLEIFKTCLDKVLYSLL